MVISLKRDGRRDWVFENPSKISKYGNIRGQQQLLALSSHISCVHMHLRRPLPPMYAAILTAFLPKGVHRGLEWSALLASHQKFHHN